MAQKTITATIALDAIVDPSVRKAVDDAQKRVNKLDSGFTTLKATVANVAADAIWRLADACRDAAKEAVQVGMSFEDSMANVKALSGATQDEFDQLEGKAKELGASTRFTASQVADGFGYMALAGWETEDMLDGIGGVLNLAQAAQMDLAEASDIVTDYLTAFGLSAEDSAGFVDQMTFAMANSNTDVTQLGEAYKNCAATAASMGYSVEDTTAVIMTMANAGTKGGEAGTALNAVMTRLATNTKGSAKELKKYGVDIYDAQGNMQSLSSILEGTRKVWDKLTDEQQANLAKTIAGTSHYSNFQLIMNGLSDKAKEGGQSFEDYSRALEDCEGSAQGMADIMNDTASGDMATMQSAIEGLEIAIFEKFESPMREAIQYVTNTVVPGLQGFFGWLTTGEQVFDEYGNVVGQAASPLENIMGLMQDLMPSIAAVGGAFAGMAVYTGVLKAVAGAQALLNAVMSANPAMKVVMIITGLISALIYLWNTNEGFRNAVQPIWDAIVGIFQEAAKVIGPILDTIGAALGPVVDFLGGALGAAGDFFGGLFGGGGEAAAQEAQSVADGTADIQQSMSDLQSTLGATEMPNPLEGISSDAAGIGGSLTANVSEPVLAAAGDMDKLDQTWSSTSQALITGSKDAKSSLKGVKTSVDSLKSSLDSVASAASNASSAMGKVKPVKSSKSSGVDGYATGGFSNGLSFVGEDPRYPVEAVISFNPAYRAQNIGYWERAGRMLGVTQSMQPAISTQALDFLGGATGDSYATQINLGGISFSPQITVQGNGDPSDIRAALKAAMPELIDEIKQALEDSEVGNYEYAF